MYEFKDKKERQRSFAEYGISITVEIIGFCVDIVLEIAAGRLIFYEQLDEPFEAFTGLIKRRGDTNLVQIKKGSIRAASLNS